MKHILAALIFLSYHASLPTMKLSQYLGDSKTYQIPLMWSGSPFVPGTEWNLLFTAKARATDADENSLIQKVTGAGISVSTSTAAVEIVPADTAELSPVTIVWDIQAENITTGEVRTVAAGQLTLARDISRGTVARIPIHTAEPPVLLGPPGKSAYQLAVEAGYTGTVQEWLASLPAAVTAENIAAALGYTPSTAAQGAKADTALQNAKSIACGVDPSKLKMSVAGITGDAAFANGIWTYAGEVGGKSCYTSNGLTIGDNEGIHPYGVLYHVAGDLFTFGLWCVVVKDNTGDTLFDAQCSSNADFPDEGLGFSTDVGSGSVTVDSSPPASFIGQRFYVGTSAPYDVWECTGPGLHDLTLILRASDFATADQGAKADSALQDASAFATAEQGELADTALQPSGDGSQLTNLNPANITGAGDAMLHNAIDFATATQGAKADTALQPGEAISTAVGFYDDFARRANGTTLLHGDAALVGTWRVAHGESGDDILPVVTGGCLRAQAGSLLYLGGKVPTPNGRFSMAYEIETRASLYPAAINFGLCTIAISKIPFISDAGGVDPTGAIHCGLTKGGVQSAGIYLGGTGPFTQISQSTQWEPQANSVGMANNRKHTLLVTVEGDELWIGIVGIGFVGYKDAQIAGQLTGADTHFMIEFGGDNEGATQHPTVTYLHRVWAAADSFDVFPRFAPANTGNLPSLAGGGPHTLQACWRLWVRRLSPHSPGHREAPTQ